MMRVYHPQRMMSILTVCIILIITTCQASQSQAQALSISQYKENYLQCNTKSDFENNKNWIFQMKVLAESQNNMTSVRGRFVKVHKTGSVIVLCYVKTIDGEDIWITKLYHISNPTSKDKGSNLVMKEILPANNPDVYSAKISEYPPLVKTKIVQSDQRYIVSCSHIFSVNEGRNLQLLRILSNGTKLFIKMNALRLSASIKRGNLIMIEYDHEFIYDPYEYLNNLFECRSVGNFFNDFKSSFSHVITKNVPLNSICHKYGGRTYYFVNSAKNYTDAKNFCFNYGMKLVHVKDEEHNEWLYKTSEAMRSKWWIGLDDETKEGHFVWQNGQLLSYTKWAKGEPNNAGKNEDCIEYSHTDKNNGLWNDVECDRVRKFICESGKKNCGISELISNNKPTQQISTSHEGRSGRAVDGNINQNWKDKSCTHTTEIRNPWWEVDLQGHFSITSIIVYNRYDCCGKRLGGFRVLVSDGPDKPFVECARGPARTTNGQIIHLDCNKRGRIVRIQLSGRKKKELTLCEVKVYGTQNFPNYVTQNELFALSESNFSVDWRCLSKCGLQSVGCITKSGCLRHKSKWNIAKCLVRKCALSSIWCVMKCLF